MSTVVTRNPSSSKIPNRTVDEMAHAWVNITYMDDEDFEVEVEKRKALEGEPATDQFQQ